MGYTHYWENEQYIEDDTWKNIRQSIEHLYSLDSNGVIANDEGVEPPLVNDHIICFNGIGGNAFETFAVDRSNIDFHCCKTNRKPYDAFVVATLMILEHYHPYFSWSSDGEDYKHKEGRKLFNKVVNS